MSVLNNPSPDVYKLIVLDDDVKIHKIIQKFFKKEHLEVKSILNPDDLSQENLFEYDAILLDFYFEGTDQNGLEIIKAIRETNKFINIILMTGLNSQNLAIQAIKFNIDDYILKPINFRNLASGIINIIEKKKIMFSNLDLNNQIVFANIFDNIIILSESVPIFAHGSWLSNGTNISYDEIILGGFFTAIQKFSTLYFGQSLNELSLANEYILFYRYEEIIICLRVPNSVSRSIISIKNKKIILDQLNKIAEFVFQNTKSTNERVLSTESQEHLLSLIDYSNSLLISEDIKQTNTEFIRIKKEKIINFIEKLHENKTKLFSGNLEDELN